MTSDPDSLRCLQAFYTAHPEMVSSPFGGVSGYDFALLERIWRDLGLNEPRALRVLEVGCGRAFLRDYFKERDCEYLGVDLIAPEGDRTAIVLAEAGALPLADETFDLLICIEAYEHFSGPERAALEFQRVLAPGGNLFLSTPNYGNVAGLVKRWMERFGGYDQNTWAPFGGWTPQAHEHFVTHSSVLRTFHSAGFRKGKRLGCETDLHLGLCPWAALPGFPERLLFPLQRAFPVLRRWLARRIPTLSLHQFWRWEK
ncbi:MAG: hypothetical protein GHCLOJNM_00485 [bacterium]|nr:hypothetical protein [bacterium]